MPSRRDFLTTVAAGLAAPAVASLRAARAALAQEAIRTELKGVVGLQLWSLRESLPKDLAGTLLKVKDMGFREVEGAGLWKHTVAELRGAMDAAGLRCRSAHLPIERLRADRAGAFAEAKALGATWVVCPWIMQGKTFTRDDALRSADAFNTIGRAAADAELHFAYHCHGYEFVPSPDGTLFDTLARATDPARVAFQMDVFHAKLGGADPVALIERYASRVASLHLKDLAKGVAITAGTPIGTPEMDVPLGSGQVDMPAVLRAASQAGTTMFYIEDESAAPLEHIPESVAFLKSFRL